jgi:hypothetical protein
VLGQDTIARLREMEMQMRAESRLVYADTLARVLMFAAEPVLYVVEWGNELPAEIDTLWIRREDAEAEAKEKGEGWHVTEWRLAMRQEA